MKVHSIGLIFLFYTYYKINTSITIGTGIKQEKFNVEKLDITISFGI